MDDDPLGFLSDNSDDSFFEDPKIVAKKIGAKKETDAKAKNVQNIFGLESEAAAKSEPSSQKPITHWSELKVDGSHGKDDSLLKNPIIREPPIDTSKTDKKPVQVQKKVSFEKEDDDILNDIELPKTSSAKKSAILDELLGKTKDSKPQEKEKPPPMELAPKPIIKPIDPPLTVEKEDPVAPKTLGQYSPSLGEARRSRRSLSVNPDPLGLLSQTFDESSRPSTGPKLGSSSGRPSTQSIGEVNSLPDWLSGTTSSKTSVAKEKTEDILPPSSTVSATSAEQMSKSSTAQEPATPGAISQTTMSSSWEPMGLLQALKHQETQLITGAQMIRHEQSMADIHMKQQEVLTRQEQQFKEMMDRHSARQKMLEAAVLQQQDIITNRLQQLAVPMRGIESSTLTIESKSEEIDESRNTSRQLLESTHELHREETSILEQSYKKQVLLLEESLSMTETRLKAEMDSMVLRHSDQLSQLRQDHEVEISELKMRLKDQVDRFKEEVENERRINKSIQERMKSEFDRVLESTREARLHEVDVIRDTHLSASKIVEGVVRLDNVERSISEAVGKIGDEQKRNLAVREQLLETKEKEVSQLRDMLEQQRLTAENERSQLMAVVKSLENRLLEQTRVASEDRWALQQATAAISASSATLEREQKHLREMTAREHLHIKTLKEELLAERERMTLDIAEERKQIAIEKGRLEVASRLLPSDHEARKVELEAALAAAKEAKDRAEIERIDLESAKRALLEQQRRADHTMAVAEQKRREGERALKEVKTLESQQQIRMHEIKQQLGSLTIREKKLAEDKIALSRERVLLQQAKRCGLCEADAAPANTSDRSAEPEERPIRNYHIDADLVRLSLDIEDNIIATKDFPSSPI